MKLSSSSLLALALVSDAKKKRRNKENDNKIQFVENVLRKSSGNFFNSWPWGHCIYEFNEDDTILTFTTIKGIKEKTHCYESIGCSDGYILHRNIASIQGLCQTELKNAFSFRYRIRLREGRE